MAVTELHRRLDYLVAYSSQLIFVSSQSLAQQQGSLQTFIGAQHESTEVAFLNGEPESQKEDYRSSIYQQLLRDTPYDSQLPLQTIFQQSDALSGQVLICICAAQHLSNAFLQELWDVVMYSRGSSDTLHLNVILFGEPDWADDAKQWLSDNNHDRPIVLSDEVIEATSHDNDSDLDKLIAQKRAEFAQRIAKRQEHQNRQETSKSVINTLWFKLTAVLIFLAVFAALLSWLYPNLLSEDEALQAELVPTETVNQPIDDEVNIPNIPTIEEAPSSSITMEPAQNTSPAVQSPQDGQTNTTLEQRKTASTKPESSLAADQQPVSTWQQEVTRLSEKNQQATDSNSPQALPSQNTTAPLTTETLPTESVEQAAAIEANSNLLLSLADNQFVIQLSAVSQEQTAEQFIEQHQLQEKVWRYTTYRFGGDWHVIVYADVFDSIAQGQAFIKTLPKDLQQTQPFIKSVKNVQEEIALVDS